MAAFSSIALGVAAAASAASAANSISASRKASSMAKDALAAQREAAANLKYEPVNIENLKQQAHEQAVLNATQSLALERELSPDVAATRQMVAERVRSDLALGGRLSPDVANQVARAARTMGALSGAPAGPLTAAQIGTTAENLKQQRLSNAGALLAANPLQPAGLDPGSLASAIVAQNAAQNQFNMAKSGVGANLAQSTAQFGASNAGLQAGINADLLNRLVGAPQYQKGGLLGQIGQLPMFQTKTPAYDVNSIIPNSSINIPGAVLPTPTPTIPEISIPPLG